MLHILSAVDRDVVLAALEIQVLPTNVLREVMAMYAALVVQGD